MAERSKAADCKSVSLYSRWFKSNLFHFVKIHNQKFRWKFFFYFFLCTLLLKFRIVTFQKATPSWLLVIKKELCTTRHGVFSIITKKTSCKKSFFTEKLSTQRNIFIDQSLHTRYTITAFHILQTNFSILNILLLWRFFTKNI